MDPNVYRQTPEALSGITYINCWSVTCQAVSARRPPEVRIRVSAIGTIDQAVDEIAERLVVETGARVALIPSVRKLRKESHVYVVGLLRPEPQL